VCAATAPEPEPRDEENAQNNGNGGGMPPPNTTGTHHAPTYTPPLVALDLRVGHAETIAARIRERVTVEMARGIAVALHWWLSPGGSWPPWLPPIIL
jgi:hypothetical protein